MENTAKIQRLRNSRESLLKSRDKYYMKQINPEETQEQAQPQKCKRKKPIIVTIYER